MDHFTFYIVDDERAARNILTDIIEDENLGEVIGSSDDGVGQDAAILHANPQVVLIDLLMPGMDGISLAQKLRHLGFKGRIVMISQVEEKEMVALAYESGVEFYITKPINRIEVMSVLRQLLFIHTVQQSLDQAIQHHQKLACGPENLTSSKPGQNLRDGIRKKVNYILYQLGVIGEAGANDIIQIVLYLCHKTREETFPGQDNNLNLQQLYREVISHAKEGGEVYEEETRALEQRLRRAIKNCFDNLAAMGLVDYGEPRFERYAGTLFDYNEVRTRMDELQKGLEKSKTRINIKKFIQALLIEVTTT